MDDETTVTTPTDSRFAGFNPEVEQSHKETGQPLNLLDLTVTVPEPEVTTPPPPPPPTHHCENCGYLDSGAADVCPSCGMTGGVVALKG